MKDRWQMRKPTIGRQKMIAGLSDFLYDEEPDVYWGDDPLEEWGVVPRSGRPVRPRPDRAASDPARP